MVQLNHHHHHEIHGKIAILNVQEQNTHVYLIMILLDYVKSFLFLEQPFLRQVNELLLI